MVYMDNMQYIATTWQILIKIDDMQYIVTEIKNGCHWALSVGLIAKFNKFSP